MAARAISANTPGASWTLVVSGLHLARRIRVAETGVVKLVVDEQRVVVLDPVTDDALRLAGEEREPALDGLVDRVGRPPKYHRSKGESAASNVRW